ncbi:MAG: TonB-dependent receptor plug domain-containing protein [Polyangiaceae bacterium]|nr:TonB-dependent receptor plug domain-containing protein [Polyangiaceae bacterium]
MRGSRNHVTLTSAMLGAAMSWSRYAEGQEDSPGEPPAQSPATPPATEPAPPNEEAPPLEPEPEPEPELENVEVTVTGMKHPPSVSSLTRAEVRQLPGAFGDPFRAIEILPGVTPIVSGLPFFYVRGAPPGNVGYFLDGVRVPYLFHAAAGPSVVHPGIVDRVDLYSGGYPAKYGRYAGAIVAAEATEPRTDWHGEANLRLVDAGALVEGGFADGRGTALLGGRYSYTAGLFSLISPDITLDYRDYQARFSYDLTSRDRISLFAFGAYDFLSQTTNDIETVIFGSEFYRVDGRYDVRFPGGGRMRTAVTFGYDQTRIADGRNTRDISLGARVELEQPLTDDVLLRAGVDVQHDIYSANERPYVDPDDPSNDDFNSLFPPRNDAAIGAWADLVWQVDPRFSITPGVRIDGFYSNGADAVSADPRLAVVVNVHERVRLLHAFGMAHQPPSFIVPLPGVAVASLRGGLQRSFQAAAGVEVDLPLSLTATATLFDSVFLDMTDTIGVRPPGDDATQIPRSTGGAKGVEVYLRRSLSSRLGGFIAYTFSRTTRSIDGYKFPAAFDRSHVLHSALSLDLGRGWRSGARFSLYTGAPQLQVPGLPDIYRPSDPERDPPFYRLDFRVEKKWRLPATGWISFVIEMVNATLNTETINGNDVGPVTIPSIGLEGGF